MNNEDLLKEAAIAANVKPEELRGLLDLMQRNHGMAEEELTRLVGDFVTALVDKSPTVVF